MTRPSVLLLAIALAGTGAVAQAQPGRPAQAVPSVPAQPGPADDASAATGPSLLALRELLQQARTHLQRGDPQAAYALLEPHTADYSNAEDFNYLLGIAALDSGRPSQAVLALERVLAHAPDHTLARAEIARAFLALRETEAAKREFEAVARADLPPEVQDTIRRYLEIVASTDRPQRRWRASVEAAIGHDDNVNFGSSLDEWVLGDGLALIPTDASRPRESAFHELSGQLHYTAPIDGQTEWTIGSQLSQRSNASQHNNDLGAVEVSGGLARTHGRDRYSMSVQLQQLHLDGKSFRTAKGLLGQWQRDVDDRTQVGAYAQLFDLGFAGQHVRDARRQVYGATLVRGLQDQGRTVLVGNLYAGRESSRREIEELSFDLHGVRLAASRSLGAGWRGSAGIGYERRSHDGADGFFGIRRRDRQLEIRLGAERELGRGLSFGPQVIHTDNSSTLAPSDFRRTQVMVTVRYRF